jgi:hypothetical protein
MCRLCRLLLRLMRRGAGRGSRLGGGARGVGRIWSISGGVVVLVGWSRAVREGCRVRVDWFK